MFANYLIGLREGLEGSLVVSILVAYLVRTGRRDRLPPVWAGVATAVVVSVAFGALLQFTATSVLSTSESRDVFAGTLSIVAVCFVTWMVFWMLRTARQLRADLDGRLSAAVGMGALAVGLTGLFAVGREGLETALLFWSAAKGAGETTAPLAGFTLGIASAVTLGWLLYRRAVTLDLARFFTWTGAGLVVVAAGVLGYGVHDLQEGGVLPSVASTLAFSAPWLSESHWYGTLVRAIFNISAEMSWWQITAYLAYLVPVMGLFLRGSRARMAPPATATTAEPAAAGSLRTAAPTA